MNTDLPAPDDPAALPWLAALIDQQGLVAVSRAVYAKQVSYRASIHVTYQAHPILAHAQTLAGVGHLRLARTLADGTPVWQWGVLAQQAVTVLRAVRPHLVQQAAAADLALAVHDLVVWPPPPGGYAPRSPETEAALAALHAAYLALPKRVHRLTDTERAAIIALRDQASAADLAARFGVSKVTVWKVLREHDTALGAQLMAEARRDGIPYQEALARYQQRAASPSSAQEPRKHKAAPDDH